MDDRDELAGVARVRRKLLKASAWTAGSVLAATLPYERPGLSSFFGARSAWAQPSGPPSVLLHGALGTGVPGSPENTGSDWWRLAVPSPATRITLAASSDMYLDVELFLFAPGVDPTIGTNLLTNSFAPYDVQGLAGGESATLVLGGPGNYVLAVEDARTLRQETAGEYWITITADEPLGGAVQIENEKAEIQSPQGKP